MITVINIFLITLSIYFGVGVIFGVYFLIKGAIKIDPLLGHSKWSVRLLLFPGTIAMWPILVSKLLKLRK